MNTPKENKTEKPFSVTHAEFYIRQGYPFVMLNIKETHPRVRNYPHYMMGSKKAK